MKKEVPLDWKNIRRIPKASKSLDWFTGTKQKDPYITVNLVFPKVFRWRFSLQPIQWLVVWLNLETMAAILAPCVDDVATFNLWDFRKFLLYFFVKVKWVFFAGNIYRINHVKHPVQEETNVHKWS